MFLSTRVSTGVYCSLGITVSCCTRREQCRQLVGHLGFSSSEKIPPRQRLERSGIVQMKILDCLFVVKCFRSLLSSCWILQNKLMVLSSSYALYICVAKEG